MDCFFSPSRQCRTTTSVTTFHNILTALPPDTLESTVAAWARNQAAALLHGRDRHVEAVRGPLRAAACFTDCRDLHCCEHPLRRLVGRRQFGLALGCEDVNDHDRLRDDSLLALAAGSDDLSGDKRRRKRDRGHPLASSGTLSRLEPGTPGQAPKDRCKRIAADPGQLDALPAELFPDRHAEAPEEIVLDVDATDDRLRCRQEGRLFHGHCDCHCYLPVHVTCGQHVLCGRLRPADRDPAEGTVPELERIVGQIRERWPQVRIIVRGDSGFCRGG